jgi:hypothetical protein
MCFVVRKTTLELEHATLTTLYLAGAKNTNSSTCQEGGFAACFYS